MSVLPSGCKYTAVVLQGNIRPRLSKEDIEKLVNDAKFDEVSEQKLSSLC